MIDKTYNNHRFKKMASGLFGNHEEVIEALDELINKEPLVLADLTIHNLFLVAARLNPGSSPEGQNANLEAWKAFEVLKRQAGILAENPNSHQAEYLASELKRIFPLVNKLEGNRFEAILKPVLDIVRELGLAGKSLVPDIKKNMTMSSVWSRPEISPVVEDILRPFSVQRHETVILDPDTPPMENIANWNANKRRIRGATPSPSKEEVAKGGFVLRPSGDVAVKVQRQGTNEVFPGTIEEIEYRVRDMNGVIRPYPVLKIKPEGAQSGETIEVNLMQDPRRDACYKVWLSKDLSRLPLGDFVRVYNGIYVTTTDPAAMRLGSVPGQNAKFVRAILVSVNGDKVILKIVKDGLPYTVEVPTASVKPSEIAPSWARPYGTASTSLEANDVVEIEGETGQFVVRAAEKGEIVAVSIQNGKRVRVPSQKAVFKGRWDGRVISDPDFVSPNLAKPMPTAPSPKPPLPKPVPSPKPVPVSPAKPKPQGDIEL